MANKDRIHYLGIGMKTVNLRNGATTVDDEDESLVAGLSWYVDAKGYVRRTTPWDMGKRQYPYLHRVLLGAETGQFVDHRDGTR